MLNLNTCTGCRACEQVCPVSCIEMTINNEGFIYPDIDQSKCIKCMKCVAACHSMKPERAICKTAITSAVTYLNDNALKCSASGGVFPLLADYFLSKDYTVFGAAYDDTLTVKHIGIRENKQLNLLQNSKYVESDTNGTFTQVKNLLNNGERVLYTGTMCQIAGLKTFLKKDYDNLFTADLICHGVPSPLLFKKYISWLSLQKKAKITSYRFRTKHKGWYYRKRMSYILSINDEDSISIKDPFCYNFVSGNTYRESCYDCKYKNRKSMADVSMGDFSGIDELIPEAMDKKGVSIVLWNTDKAKALIENLSDKMRYSEISFEQATKTYNQAIINSTKRPKIRDTIYEGITELSDTEYIETKLVPSKISTKGLIASYLPVSLVLKIKKILNKS